MNTARPHRRTSASFWQSAGGILTGAAAIITAIGSVYAIMHHAPPTAELYAVPAEVQKGQSTTLSWHTTHASIVGIEEIGVVGPSGSMAYKPASSILLHLTATGAGGTYKTSAQITVAAPVSQPDHSAAPVQGNLNPLDGDWRGTLSGQLPLVFHIDSPGGASSADSPSQGAYGIHADAIVSGNGVQFTIPSLKVTFQGTFKGTTMSGSFSQNARTLPLALTWSAGGGGPGEAVGNWQGVLVVGNPVPLEFHIKLHGASTVDCPSQGIIGRQTDVTASGNDLQFSVPSVGATFQGILQGVAISGIYSQNGYGMDLTLTKR